MAPLDAIWLFSVLTFRLQATSWLPTTLFLLKSACGNGYAGKKTTYLKRQVIQLAIRSTVGAFTDNE